nr:uncharacterized AAA domain-containing protein C16E9.10c-like isoform X1 [Onthophagus taurus]
MMGKISTCRGIEVIPLNTNNQKYLNPVVKKHSLEGDMNRLPFVAADRVLIPRVQKYLESHVDKVYITIDDMADELQRTYKEYAKRKREGFRASVKQAYLSVLRAYGVNDQQGSSSEDLSDEEVAPGHFMDGQLADVYKRNIPKTPVDSNELIDISSDDSDDGSRMKKPTNGPSTSHENTVLPEDFVETEMLKNNERSRAQMGRGKKRKMDSYNTLLSVKRKKTVASLEESFVTFKNVGGNEKILEEICMLLVHMKHPEVYRQIGVPPPRGILLQGPSGCGKTLIANAIAGELEVPLLKVSASELIHGVAGESEERIRELFEKAIVASPCVLFIDELDTLMKGKNQKDQKSMHHRIVSQLLSSLDDLSKNEGADQVLVIAATNKPERLVSSLKRAGRFDKEINLGVPSYDGRLSILKVLSSKLKLAEEFTFESIAKHTPGYVGADLVTLIREAAMMAVNRAYTDVQEKLSLKRAMALQKLEEEKAKAEASLITKQNEEKDKEEAKDDDDDEVVDIETTDKKDDEEKEECAGGDAVVIIDDDVKEKAQVEVNKEDQLEEPLVNPATLIDFKQKTKLEELLSWLHREIPFDDKHLGDVCISMDDFARALKIVRPSLQREGFVTIPNITWNDIGAMNDIRQELQLSILGPIQYTKQFKSLKTSTKGILLCGPPGCGKTLAAKAIANEAGINFISIKGPELLNMYIGDNEQAIQACFEKARYSAPCVLFLDQFDVLCAKRSDTNNNESSTRILNQMITEIDNINGIEGIYFIAASNKPDNIDPEILQLGRLNKILYVDLPSSSNRPDILRVITKGGTHPLLGIDVDLEIIGKSEECDGFTSGDLVQLVEAATMESIKEIIQAGEVEKEVVVTTEHFKKAVAKVKPALSEKDLKHYEKLKKLFGTKSPENDFEEMEYS